MANCALWVSESELSEEFLSSGGFGTKAAGEYVAKRDDRYRIPCAVSYTHLHRPCRDARSGAFDFG